MGYIIYMNNMATEGKMMSIYLANTGEMACEKHTPYRGSDTWLWDGWARVTRAEVREAKRISFALKCEHPRCSAHA